VNTLCYVRNPKEYILGTLDLIGQPDEDKERAKALLESAEYADYVDKLHKVKKTRAPINSRLSIYYGEPGTGKTTIAEQKAAVKIVASSTMDDSSLFGSFNPLTKSFELSALGQAMRDGQTVVIDEVNLAPIGVLQRLQAITDNSKEFVENDQKDSDGNPLKIKIHDNFKVILTLNVETNLGCHYLPSPLVSRAAEIRHFTSDDLSWVF
jgi:midasin (ATPase involved in ribosome maturation)